MYATALILMVGILLFTWEPKAEKPEIHAAPVLSWAGFPWLKMAGICSITLFASILFYLVQVQLPLLLQLLGVASTAQSGLFQSLVSLGVPAGTVIFRYASHIPPLRLLSVSFAVFGVSFIAMGFAPNVPFLMAVGVLSQIAAGVTLPTLLTWAMRGLPFALRGRGTGIWQGTFSLGQFLMPIVVTVLTKALGGLFPAVAAVGGAALIAAVLSVTFQTARHLARRPLVLDQQPGS
jgi:MFS family permease